MANFDISATPPRPRNRVKIWRDSAFLEAEFLSAHYPFHCFPAHAHEEYAVGFIESGAQQYITAKKQKLVMAAGTVCAINPGDVHSGGPATEHGWNYRMIYLSARDMAVVLSDEHGIAAPHLPVFDSPTLVDPEVREAMRMAHSCFEYGDASRLEKTSRLTHALNLLARRHGHHARASDLPGALPAAVKIAREYIDAHFTENPTLQDVATVAGLSTSHLLRSFREIVGVTPHAYLSQRRVALARHLLLKGRPMLQIAIETGFSDQAHFSREFRRFYGVAPRSSRY